MNPETTTQTVQKPPQWVGQARFFGEFFASQGIVRAIESIRAGLVHPDAEGKYQVLGRLAKQPIQPLLTPDNSDPVIYQVLQNSGDFYDGFNLGFGIYNVLTLVGRNRISERTKLAISAVVASGIVVGVESGMFSNLRTADWWDMPAGFAGVACYIGTHYFIRRFLLNNYKSIEQEFQK